VHWELDTRLQGRGEKGGGGSRIREKGCGRKGFSTCSRESLGKPFPKIKKKKATSGTIERGRAESNVEPGEGFKRGCCGYHGGGAGTRTTPPNIGKTSMVGEKKDKKDTRYCRKKLKKVFPDPRPNRGRPRPCNECRNSRPFLGKSGMSNQHRKVPGWRGPSGGEKIQDLVGEQKSPAPKGRGPNRRRIRQKNLCPKGGDLSKTFKPGERGSRAP